MDSVNAVCSVLQVLFPIPLETMLLKQKRAVPPLVIAVC